METYINKQDLNNLGAFKLHMDHLHYVVDEDMRKVTAYAEVYVNLPWTIYKYLHFEKLPEGLHAYSAISMEGSAICAPEDNFNLDLGKKLAKMHLEEKAYNKISTLLANWVNELHSLYNKTEARTLEFIKRGDTVIKENARFQKELLADNQKVNPQIS